MDELPADLMIPYQVPPEELPAPLPSHQDIVNSPNGLAVTSDGEVIAVGEHFVVKCGLGVRFEEGFNMIFVSRTTNIRVPKVYQMYERGGQQYIVMERLRGTELSAYWRKCTEEEKAEVIEQVEEYFEELRSVEPPQHFGGIWRQPLTDLYVNPSNTGIPAGPMDTEEQFFNRLVMAAEAIRGTGDELPEELVEPLFEAASKGRPPVLTHGDLHMRNLIRQEDGTLVIIDWEFAGWCPVYWERNRLNHLPYRSDWEDRVGALLGGYDQELDAMKLVINWIRGDDSPVEPEW